jgi:hypothetical protein
MKPFLTSVFLFISVSCFSQRTAISTKDSLKSFLSRLIYKALTKKRFKKLVVLDFTDPFKKTSNVGIYVAEQLSIYATDVDSITILDRQNLESIIKEHKLKDKDFLVDPKALQEFGKFSGAEVLIVGKIAVFEKECSIQLYLKVVDINTAQTLSAAEEYIPMDERFADISGLSMNCFDTKEDDIPKPGKGHTRPTVTNEQYNNSQELQDAGCEDNNTGTCCFFNSTSQDLIVILYKVPLKENTTRQELEYGPNEQLKVKPKESKCMYKLPGGYSYHFEVIVAQNNSNDKTLEYFDYGSIMISKCLSKTYTIRSLTTSKTKKGINEVTREGASKLFDKGLEIIKDKMRRIKL